MKPALFCEVNFPVFIPDEMKQKLDEPAPNTFRKDLHQAIQKKSKKEVIQVLATELSRRGAFSDYWEQNPGDWAKFQELRGK